MEHNLIRNTGDDGLAMWSDQDPDRHNVFRFNTIQVPLLANGIAIYGGADNEVSDNVVADTVYEGGGIHLSYRFSGTVNLTGTITVARNTVLRSGGAFPQLSGRWGRCGSGPRRGRSTPTSG